MQSSRVIVSGGGTGGHIFPAIAIANAIKRKYPDAQLLFVGAIGKMEMEKVPEAGYAIEGLKIAGLQRSLTLKNLSFPFKLIGSIIKARSILKKFKPDVAVGVGGYASGPMLYVASKAGIPSLIQEQNSYPGITNKILAKKVNKICVAYDKMDRFFPKEKLILTGNPVRKEVINLEGKKDRGLEYFNLDKDKKTVLVVGGSLGARTINESIAKYAAQLAENNIQVIWQTGKSYVKESEVIAEKYENIKAHTFITKMDYAYAVADLVVSRAGAMSVSELCLVKKAAVLVPSPNVAEDHQTKNAMALVNHNAAVMVKDIEARNELGGVVIDLLNNQEKRNKLELQIAGLAFNNAADIIANEVLSLIKS